jgi:hypothetical protein
MDIIAHPYGVVTVDNLMCLFDFDSKVIQAVDMGYGFELKWNGPDGDQPA